MHTRYFKMAARGGAVIWDTAQGLGLDFRLSLEFFIDIMLPAPLWSRGLLSL